MLSAKVYNAAGKNVDFVRQSDIDKVRYLELIMKLARQQGGRVANRDVMSLLHLERYIRQREAFMTIGAVSPHPLFPS